MKRVHLIGIGGAGMSGVARILLARGAVVSGSDARDSRIILALRSMGAHVAVGHAAGNLSISGELPDVVVTSFAAIPEDNPELVAAKEHGIPVIRRSDLLAELMDGYTQVLLAGTHGKTSTTSMTVVAMQAAGMDPSFAIGGQLNKAGTNAHHGTGDCFVAEADESDASLLRYSPDIAVVTNIEPDHLDFFHNAEAYFKVFDDFADKARTLVVCLDDDNAVALGERAQANNVNVVGYGTGSHESIPNLGKIVSMTPEPFGSRATFNIDGQIAYADVLVPGEHMVRNGAAALLAGYLAGGDVDKLAEGLSGFTGVRRRFEHRGTTADGIRLFDDYAHHPTEVRAVLSAAKQKGRVIVVFQPHLYSRTIEFAQEFADALSLADHAIVLDIFGAREQPVEGVDGRIITSKMTIPATYIDDFSAVPQAVANLAQPGDVLLTMGAGNVTMLADEILDHVS